MKLCIFRLIYIPKTFQTALWSSKMTRRSIRTDVELIYEANELDTELTSIHTGDFNPATNNDAFAKMLPLLRGKIAHGFDTVFQFPKLLDQVMNGFSYRAHEMKLSFTKPVKHGNKYRIKVEDVKLIDKKADDGSLDGYDAIITLVSKDLEDTAVVTAELHLSIFLDMVLCGNLWLHPQERLNLDYPLPTKCMTIDEFEVGQKTFKQHTVNQADYELNKLSQFQTLSTDSVNFAMQLSVASQLTEIWGMQQSGAGCLMARINLKFNKTVINYMDLAYKAIVTEVVNTPEKQCVYQDISVDQGQFALATGNAVIRPLTEEERIDVMPFLQEWGIVA